MARVRDAWLMCNLQGFLASLDSSSRNFGKALGNVQLRVNLNDEFYPKIFSALTWVKGDNSF